MSRDTDPGRRHQDVLGDGAFARLMADVGPFETAPHVAVAVSGGADSLCLALLAGRWAAAKGGRVRALTVDHGLRPDSGAEAERVGRWMAARGIAHEILGWTGEKPRTGIQAAARQARYGLLGRWCRDQGVLHLLLAHTEDDQAETVLIRLGAGSGPDGLAAMAPVRETADVRLLRPLLAVPKRVLARTLSAMGQEWIDDAANRDPAFARTGARAAIAEGAWRAEALAQAAHRFGRQRQALEAATSVLLARAAFVHPAGFAKIDCGPMAAAPDEISLRALSRTIAAVGGREYAPPLAKLERLHADVMTGTGGTLGGCRAVVTAGRLLVCREARNLPAAVAARPGMRLHWDRRFAIGLDAASAGAADASLGALGDRGWAEIAAVRPDLRPSPVPAPARAALPVLRDAGGVIEAPHLGYRRQGAAAVAFARARFTPPDTLSGVGFALPKAPGVLSL